jgi:hypothetical protein
VVLGRADGLQVGVELGAEVRNQSLELVDLLITEELPAVSAPEPVAGLIQRASADAHESAVLGV